MNSRTSERQLASPSRKRSGGHDNATEPSAPAEIQQLSKQDYERLAELRYALRRFARHTELETRRVGASPQQYLLLLAVKGFPGREWANITELAERLQIRHNAVIGLVNRAEAHGLVTRSQDADRTDRRVVQIRLTQEGERLLQAMVEALWGERARVRSALVGIQDWDKDA
jgi:DNA-binding MarR family transcriptional regulator